MDLGNDIRMTAFKLSGSRDLQLFLQRKKQEEKKAKLTMLAHFQ